MKNFFDVKIYMSSLSENTTISIQGYPGSFHDEAATKYFGSAINQIPADSFDILAKQLSSGSSQFAVMAIENSIAGSILQNYRILREHNFWILGEVYLRIKHNFLVNAGSKIDTITQVSSHPMALNQCLDFLRNYPHIKLVESEDTALSAIHLAKNPDPEKACIASLNAARLTGLEVLAEGIESNKTNYTRFFILSKHRQNFDDSVNKASVYFRIPDKKGQLLKVLACIDDLDLNMSKLQSFPVLGKFREYFFHLDVEFDSVSQYDILKSQLKDITFEYAELGIYQRADLTDALFNSQSIPADHDQ